MRIPRVIKFATIFVAISVALLSPGLHGRAAAVDTTEARAIGATDVEMFIGLGGIGLDRDKQELGVEMVLGYGLTPTLSACLTVGMKADGYLAGQGGSLAATVFVTPLRSRHVEADIFITAAFVGGGLLGFELTPAFELNLNGRPDMSTWGAWLKGGAVMSGEKTADGGKTNVSLPVAVGFYYTVSKGHQLLLEADITVEPNSAAGQRKLDFGSVALGYNFAVAGNIEAVTQVALDVPGKGEKLSAALLAGMIITLEGSARVASASTRRHRAAARLLTERGRRLLSSAAHSPRHP